MPGMIFRRMNVLAILSTCTYLTLAFWDLNMLGSSLSIGFFLRQLLMTRVSSTLNIHEWIRRSPFVGWFFDTLDDTWTLGDPWGSWLTETENGFMEPKWPMRFVSVIGHPGPHHLRIWPGENCHIFGELVYCCFPKKKLTYPRFVRWRSFS